MVLCCVIFSIVFSNISLPTAVSHGLCCYDKFCNPIVTPFLENIISLMNINLLKKHIFNFFNFLIIINVIYFSHNELVGVFA